MKVVLFCGGFGMRLREHADSIPKPMVKIGHRPILWHLMKYYAHFGHKHFILCLGWKATVIKQYFLNYNECMSKDFVLTAGGTKINLLGSDIEDWKITFVDTGPTTSIGQRLKAVAHHLEDDELFLANYADGLTNFHLPDLTEAVEARKNVVGGFLAVKPRHSFHAIKMSNDNMVTGIEPIEDADVWMNGGFFAFRREIFRYIEAGEDLVDEPFRRLIRENRLYTRRYNGFWGCMDTFKEKQMLDDMVSQGTAPWEVWNPGARPLSRPLGTDLANDAAEDGRRAGTSQPAASEARNGSRNGLRKGGDVRPERTASNGLTTRIITEGGTQ